MEYFAALEQTRLVGELQARIDAYYNWILLTNRLSRWRVAYNTYYGQRGTHSSQYVSAAGDKGELSFLMSNEYRNLVQHTLVMAMQSRTALETVAINTDSRSKAQAYVAKGLIEYYRRDGNIDLNGYAAAEISMIMDTGWVFNEWDVNLGNDVTVDSETGRPVRQGDVKSRARTPLDVVIDFTKLDSRAHDWRMVRDPVNKFDLAAQYPEQAEELTKITRDLTKDALFRFGDIVNYHASNQTDDIDVWTFFHRRSPALPQGRMVQFCDKYVIFDGPIPYRKLPGNRICPAEQILSPLGYSNANDLLGLQDVLDALVSAGVTNMTTCGVNNIWTKPSPNFDFEQLANGMNLIECEEPPQVLIMNKLPPEWFNLANWIMSRMQSYLGQNDVSRGNLDGKDMSGAAMALLQSMSIQFNSGFVRSVNKLTEDNGNDIIMLTQDFAQEPRLGMIIGEASKYMMKEYSGADLNQIQRVYCRQSNPMKDTTSGRLTIAKEANSTRGGISPAQFSEIIDTGNTDCLLEGDRNLKLTISQENEALIRGEIPPVVFTDRHHEHIPEHAKVYASPEDRADSGLIARGQAHIQQHLAVWGSTDPNILQALGIPPLIPPPMLPPPGAVAPGGAGGSGPGTAPPPPSGSGPGGMPPPGASNAGADMMQADNPPNVRQPGMPTNPLSGQKWDPQTGGMPPPAQ